MLDKEFLAPYYAAGDCFPNLLARSTYISKYKRDIDTCWTDTAARVVLGNIKHDINVSRFEVEKLFDAIWRGYALPPGRGLWTGGVEGIPVGARNNCAYITIKSVDDWCWVADQLMLGCGVGVGLLRHGELPTVARGNVRLHLLCSRSHPNQAEVLPDDPPHVENVLLVDDSRQGWIEALRETLHCAFEGKPLTVNVSSIRPRGARIKTFGGIACGPGPLATLLRNVWAIVRGAAGRKLSSVECLDITNHVGLCIKSGNVRRSALIVLGDANDRAFRDAKKDFNAVLSHRSTSNNSIVFDREEQFDSFDWRALVEDNAEYGEPGILNLWKIRQTDPGAQGINPCGEQPLHDKEVCNLSEVYPARYPKDKEEEILQLITRYTIRQRLSPMEDPEADAVRVRNMRIGIGLGGICDFAWTPSDLEAMRQIVRETAAKYSSALGVAIPIATTTVKPSGTISLLCGSSPGIHAPYAPYYIRRTRISKQEPMALALQEAGVPNEDCVYDKTGNTLVFEFPMSAPQATEWVTTESVETQIQRQMTVQKHWADNAVSTTISFREDEKENLAQLLGRHAKDMKSISCLPKSHGYEQPPYEAIERSEFERRHAAINHAHPLVSGGELEVDECSTGACPVR